MTDRISAQQRSLLMGKIKGRNTKPELLVRKQLHRLGYRFRLFDKHLPCHPDIVLKRYKTAIFVHGCFWHGHEGCRYFKLPKSNIEFWENKITTNRKRDAGCIDALEKLGWNVVVIWECQLKPKVWQDTLDWLDSILKSSLSSDRQSEGEYFTMDYSSAS